MSTTLSFVLMLVALLAIAALLAVLVVVLRRIAVHPPTPHSHDGPQRGPGWRASTATTAMAATGTAEEEADAVAGARAEADAIRAAAADAARQTRAEAEGEAARIRAEAQLVRDELAVERDDADRRAAHLAEREERLDADLGRIADERTDLTDQRADLRARQAELTELQAEHTAELERVAGLTAEAARAELIASLESEARLQAATLIRDIEREARAEADHRARGIITSAVQRLASEQTAESVVTVLHLPGDEMKGRIIGREGRNVRTFEQVTGVNVIIDDTPEAVLLSCFDPVRREVARVTLEKLVLDGRIHPNRIEETYAVSRDEVEQMCQRAGESAVLEMGISDLHPELVRTLGHLKYRTSYGQNVLLHLVESGHAAALMAAELGLDVDLCRRAAFLHDIGKALTHESEGSHAHVGAELARRFGECDDVAHAIEAHHNEVEVRTVEAVLTQAADAISGGRPGARRESLEAYVTRLQRLEEIATGHDGVEKVFAMQAGREVRVMVLPDKVDDLAAGVMAREIAKQVEEELTYPGHIRVTVVRESRATEYAK